jgi:hypothetical protein
VLALITLPFLDPSSPEFVADAIALTLSGSFCGLIVWSVRRAARIPMPDDPSPARRQRDAQGDEADGAS